jgi:ferredoxin
MHQDRLSKGINGNGGNWCNNVELQIMKVTIERNTCVSCGSCWDTCPNFFEQNPDDSFSEIIKEFRIGDDIAAGTPQADDEACVRDAADLCPVTIIKIED